MLCTNRPSDIDGSLIFKINDSPIDLVNYTKFSCIQLDRDLNFSSHARYISVKLAKVVGIFNRIHVFIPQSSLINLYYSLFYPHLIYCIQVWGNASDAHIKPIVTLQKRIIRLITNSGYLEHTTPLFAKTKILKFHDIYNFLIGVHMFKLNLDSRIQTISHSYNTRQRHNAHSTFQRLSQCQRSLSYVGPKIWNEIPSFIKECKSLASFKKMYNLIDCY